MDAKNSEKYLDMDVALSHVDGDRQFLAELSAMFLQDYPKLIGEARQSIQQGDHRNVERIAHTLKGRLAFFGILKGREEVAKLEMLGRTNELQGAGEALDDVEREMAGILPEFESLSREQDG